MPALQTKLEQPFAQLRDPARQIRETLVKGVQAIPAAGQSWHPFGVERLQFGDRSGLERFQIPEPRFRRFAQREFRTREQRLRQRRWRGGLFCQQRVDFPQQTVDRREKVREFRRHAGGTRKPDIWIFDFQQMPQPRLGFAQGGVRLVEKRKGRAVFRSLVRMRRPAERVEFLFDLLRVQPWAARFAEQGEEILGHACRQAEKLSPQEQCATALGFVTLKPPFCKSSL